MTIAVVAYPVLNRADTEWIEAFRAAHDPHTSKIKAHFTLVFPVESPPDQVDREIALVAASTERLSFQVASAIARDDGARCLVVLEPDEGSRDIVTVHDRLYAGILKPRLRRDLPFVPHMTIGAATDRQSADVLAAAASVRGPVRGELTSLALIEVDAHVARTIATYRLGIGPECRGCR